MQKQIDRATSVTRRDALAAAVGLAAAGTVCGYPHQAAPAAEPIVKKGRIKQSACRWCYSKLPLDELAAAAGESAGDGDGAMY